MSRSVQLSLVPITFGVGYATVYDLNLNTLGFGKLVAFTWKTIHDYFSVFAACAVIATSLAQIFTNTYQKSLDCNALQLLYHTTPYITLVCHNYYVFFLMVVNFAIQGMLVMCPFFDDLNALSTYKYTMPCIIRIVVSCVFALGVNISNYLVLGKTSPLTYQVRMLWFFADSFKAIIEY